MARFTPEERAEREAEAQAREAERAHKARSRAAKKAARTRAAKRAAAADETWLLQVTTRDLRHPERGATTELSEVSLATHHVMQANPSANTKPELLVRAALRAAGHPGYRLHWKAAPGRPDVCYPGLRVAIFVHGCFWHACPHCTPRRPTTRQDFWDAKFARNQARDARQLGELVAAGWVVLVVWECRLKGPRAERTLAQLVRELERAAAEGPRRPEGRACEVGGIPHWARARR